MGKPTTSVVLELSLIQDIYCYYEQTIYFCHFLCYYSFPSFLKHSISTVGSFQLIFFYLLSAFFLFPSQFSIAGTSSARTVLGTFVNSIRAQVSNIDHMA